MISTFVLSFPISALEANFLVTNLTNLRVFIPTANGMYTEHFKDVGILNVNIWMNKDKFISEPLTTENCMINATIHYQFAKNKLLSLSAEEAKNLSEQEINAKLYEDICNQLANILKTSKSELPYTFNREIKWKIQSATFTYNFIGSQLKNYYYLLSGGYNLTKLKLDKKVTITTPTQGDIETIYKTEYVSSLSKKKTKNAQAFRLSIQWNQSTATKNITNHPLEYIPNNFVSKDNLLQIKFAINRTKMLSICKDYNIQERNFKQFMTKADCIEKDIFIKYISYIIGKSNPDGTEASCSPDKFIKYYKYKQAEKIIDASGFTRKHKIKMQDVLKSVASYKGISNYLNHVEDEKPAYETMYSVRKKTYALKLLRDIQSLGICPLNIPVKAKTKVLENPVSIFLNNTYTKIDTPDTKQK